MWTDETRPRPCSLTELDPLKGWITGREMKENETSYKEKPMMLSSPTAFIPSFSLDDAPKSTIMECKTLAVQPSRTNIGLLVRQ